MAFSFEEFVLTNEQKESFDQNGYIVFENLPFIAERLDELRTVSESLLESEGDRAGWEGKEQYYKPGKAFEIGANRLGNLIDKHSVYRDLLNIPELMASAKYLIGNDKEIKVGGVDLREPLPGEGHQQIHIDWLPRQEESDPYVGAVAFIFLDDSNLENGAIRLAPGTHHKLGWPEENIDVGNEPDDLFIRVPAKAGTLMIMNLNLWHAGCKNISGTRRRTLLIDVRERTVPQLLNFKKFLSDETMSKLSDEQKYLLAVREEDPTQAEDSVGPGEYYRKKFGDKRKEFEQANR
jgi:ectoine hydroxylase-related dioxygenase (phytanoyl-CoA dioxygenase family)